MPNRRLALIALVLLAAAAVATTAQRVRALTSAYIPAPAYHEHHALSCESAALHIALAARGVDVSEDWLQGQYGTDLRPPVVSGNHVIEWGNPYLDFVGNVDGQMAWTGYGVYESRVVVAAHRAGFHAWSGEGWSPGDLYNEVALGNPVVVWVPWSLEPPVVRTISTFDGQTVWFSGQEHAQALIGFDLLAGTITLDDPLSGSIRTFSMSLFEQRFAQFHSGAVVVGTPNASPTVGVAGTDHALYTNHGGGWSRGGGELLFPPATVTEDDGTALYIATGTDHALYIRSDTSDWQPVSSWATYCRSGPGAAVSGSLLVVACEGSDQALWVGETAIKPGVVPSIPSFGSLGGTLGSAPAVAIIGGVPTYAVSGPAPASGQVRPPGPTATPTPAQHSSSAATPSPTPTPTPSPTPRPPGTVVQPPATPVWTRTDTSGWSGTPFACVDTPALVAQDGVVLFACNGTDNALWYGTAAGTMPGGARSAGGVLEWGVGGSAVDDGFAVDVEGDDQGVYEIRIVGGDAQYWGSLGGTAVDGVRAG